MYVTFVMSCHVWLYDSKTVLELPTKCWTANWLLCKWNEFVTNWKSAGMLSCWYSYIEWSSFEFQYELQYYWQTYVTMENLEINMLYANKNTLVNPGGPAMMNPSVDHLITMTEITVELHWLQFPDGVYFRNESEGALSPSEAAAEQDTWPGCRHRTGKCWWRAFQRRRLNRWIILCAWVSSTGLFKYTMLLYCIVLVYIFFGSLTLLVGRQEGQL